MLDDGDNVQHIKFYEGQQPEDIVDDFGKKFNSIYFERNLNGKAKPERHSFKMKSINYKSSQKIKVNRLKSWKQKLT